MDRTACDRQKWVETLKLSTNLEHLRSRMGHLQAKSGGRAELFDHLMDVCGQAGEFLKAYHPEWPLADGASLPRMLAYASLLHDFGKIHPGFQTALEPGGQKFQNRHEILSLAFLDWLEIPDVERLWIASAVATHHRSWFDVRQRFPEAVANFSEVSETNDCARLCRGVPESDGKLLYQLLGFTGEVFSELGWPGFELYPLSAFRPIDYTNSIPRWLRLIDSFTRKIFIGESALRPGKKAERDWNLVLAGIHMRGWLLSSDHLASFRREKIGTAFRSRGELNLLYQGFAWKPYQELVGDHKGSGILIAPTGSGKTEAGLLWASRQAELGTGGRVCVLLPYQTSLNAMQKRLVERLLPDQAKDPLQWNRTVGLLHGRATRHLYEAFLERPDIASEAQELARNENSLGRLLAAPVAVSTVFSIIRLLFATKGPERLFATFFGARIIVDEIHAYTPEVTAMTLAALRFLKEHLGAQVLFMSATVPSHLEAALERTLGVGRILAEPPWGDKSRHRLSLLEFDCLSDQALDLMASAAADSSVLVVVNQVKRAMEVQQRIEGRGLRTRLLHSRFHFADRARIEQGLTPKRGEVLVGTQAVEVSLDLDFDVCFSELAPIESIAQRFGRCNRRGQLASPGVVHLFTGFPNSRGELPYDAGHLANVLKVLRRFVDGGARDLSDRDLSELMEESYSEEMKQTLALEIEAQAGRLRKAFLDDWKPFGLQSRGECETLEKAWEKLFDGSEVLPECLVPKAQAESSKLGAARYMVPLSGYQMARYWGEMDWHEELGCLVIRRNYGVSGLEL